MNIDVVADLHGFRPVLAGGDLLVIAGDLTARDEEWQYEEFFAWSSEQKYKRIVLIGGNHDNRLSAAVSRYMKVPHMTYLCDSGTEFEGLKIWGTPWTKTFRGMNPHCKAFTFDTETELGEKWTLIPEGIDLLVTHSPPYGIRDVVVDGHQMKSVGSTTLLQRILVVKPKVVVFGHIHEGYGREEVSGVLYVNASHVNQRYKPVNLPVRIVV